MQAAVFRMLRGIEPATKGLAHDSFDGPALKKSAWIPFADKLVTLGCKPTHVTPNGGDCRRAQYVACRIHPIVYRHHRLAKNRQQLISRLTVLGKAIIIKAQIPLVEACLD